MIVQLSENEIEALAELAADWECGGVRPALALAIALARAIATATPVDAAPVLARLLENRPALTPDERLILQAVAAKSGTDERGALAHVINAAGLALPGGSEGNN